MFVIKINTQTEFQKSYSHFSQFHHFNNTPFIQKFSRIFPFEMQSSIRKSNSKKCKSKTRKIVVPHTRAQNETHKFQTKCKLKSSVKYSIQFVSCIAHYVYRLELCIGALVFIVVVYFFVLKQRTERRLCVFIYQSLFCLLVFGFYGAFECVSSRYTIVCAAMYVNGYNCCR